MEKSPWDIPQNIMQEGEKFFSLMHIQNAIKLLSKSKITISFTKGTPETYYIVSGIAKDDRVHEAKLVYKKRLAAPLTSNCDCHLWTNETHCPHVAALYFNYHLKLLYQSDIENKVIGQDPSRFSYLGVGLGVHPAEYGTIINHAHKLEGAPQNATYTSVQYILTSKKIVNFPIPNSLSGKLVVLVSSGDFSDDGIQVKFKYQDENLEQIDEVSIFENLYLFDWKNGNAYHLPNELKDFVQRIRLYSSTHTINDLIENLNPLCKNGLCVAFIDQLNLMEIEEISPGTRIILNPGEKKGMIKIGIHFHNDAEQALPPPALLTSLTFTGGLLGSFKKKKDSYSFILGLVNFLKDGHDSYKRTLICSSQKSRWNTLITNVAQTPHSLIYDKNKKALCLYDNHFLRLFTSLLYECFSEMLFRFSTYNEQNHEISFETSPALLFKGLSEFYRKLRPYGVTIFYDRNKISSWNSSRVRFERKRLSTQWFDLELNVSDSDLEIIKNADLETGLAVTSKGLVMLSNEQLDLMKFMKKYTEFEKRGKPITEEGEAGEENLNKFVLPFTRSRIFELFELKKMGIEGALTQEEEELCHRLATLTEMPQYPVPESLEQILRPYQKVGYNWLRFLYENNLGACLADDMGLGKTLQAISFIKSVYDQIGAVLIVCPVTIILNWEKEFKKFSDLKVHIYHGGERKFPEDTKIIITSYGVMKKEAVDVFQDKNFDIFVLDEVQHLKNIRSLGAFAARKINAKFRICLTGTPVENDLAEFYNILDLSIPGIWGDLQFIRASSTKKTRLLARKTSGPFILRRTKAQVLTDLPPKIDNTVYLAFSDEERDSYQRSLVNVRNRINIAPSKKKYGEILKGRLELRQTCLWQKSHLGLSTKVDFLVENLEQILEEGHQAIVFSQFTTYLDIIQKVLKEKHWKIARIDGTQKMKKRQEQVDLFQEGHCPIFLISLKAGGVGLNLTSASYVFMMDPWWNPAVENQAIDRAHRIGQKNTLTVYRPIIKNTVEEKVLQLQEIKKELFYDLLPENDEEHFSGKLTMKDFEALLDI